MTTKKRIEAKVTILAGLTGVNYKTSCMPQYGGYDLYYLKEGESGHWRGKYGFDCRKRAREMEAYLDGIINALT